METDIRPESGDEADDNDGVISKKRRVAEIQFDRKLELTISKLGDKIEKDSLLGEVQTVADWISADMASHRTKLISLLIDNLEYSHKLSMYSTLVGLLNVRDHLFGSQLIEALMMRLRECLRQCSYNLPLNIVGTGLGGLQWASQTVIVLMSRHSSNCVCLQSLLNAALQQAHVPQVHSDWYVRACLRSLPYVGRVLAHGKAHELDSMLDAVHNYMRTRLHLHTPMLSVWSVHVPLTQMDSLDSLWAQVCRLREHDWLNAHLLRPYEACAGALADALQHHLPPFIPPAHQPSNTYPLPAVTFRLFATTDVPAEFPPLPATDSIERLLMEEDLRSVIHQWYDERKDCASALLACAQNVSVPVNYLILESVFGGMFELPCSQHLQLFYGSLLIELCKLQPNTMPQVLAQSAELLYQRVHFMQPACTDRFVNWFAYHLSNFQYRWSWEDWRECVQLDECSPRRLFVTEVLQKILRFSYYERVLEVVTDAFQPLMPPKPCVFFRYAQHDGASLPGAEVAERVREAIKAKMSAEEVLQIALQCPRIDTDSLHVGNAGPVQVFVLTLLHLGSKTFTHSFAALTKYHSALKQLTHANDEAQLVVLDCVYELWATHTQMICVLVDKLLKMLIVDMNAVVNWIFSTAMRKELIRQWVWDIIDGSLLKMHKHVNRMRQDVTSLASATQPELDDTEQSERDSELAQLTDRLNEAQTVRKNLLMTLFRNFIVMLTEHIMNCEEQGETYDTAWFHLMVGRLRHMFLVQQEEVSELKDDFSELLFADDVDARLLEVFHQFCALRQ